LQAEISVFEEIGRGKEGVEGEEFLKLKVRFEDLEGERNGLLMDFDKRGADVGQLKDDVDCLVEDLGRSRLELGEALREVYEKDRIISERQEVLKSVFDELRSVKNKNKVLQVEGQLSLEKISILTAEIDLAKGLHRPNFKNHLDTNQKPSEAMVLSNPENFKSDSYHNSRHSSEILGRSDPNHGGQAQTPIEVQTGSNSESNLGPSTGKKDTGLAGSGGQEDLKDTMNSLIIEYSIQIEDFKLRVMELEESNFHKNEHLEKLDQTNSDCQRLIRDYETKRKNALTEISNLRDRLGLDRNSILNQGKHSPFIRSKNPNPSSPQPKILPLSHSESSPSDPSPFLKSPTNAPIASDLGVGVIDRLHNFAANLNNELKSTYRDFVVMVAQETFGDAI
jgi:hypothetical protein